MFFARSLADIPLAPFKGGILVQLRKSYQEPKHQDSDEDKRSQGFGPLIIFPIPRSLLMLV